MKRAFSLLEIIIVIVVISIISSFIISKTSDSLDSSVKTKIKSEIALIRNSIGKLKTKNILLKNDSVFLLDNASINMQNSELFSNILDFPLISSTKEIKELGKWIKIGASNYMIFINEKEKIEFIFEENSFSCESETSLCKTYE